MFSRDRPEHPCQRPSCYFAWGCFRYFGWEREPRRPCFDGHAEIPAACHGSVPWICAMALYHGSVPRERRPFDATGCALTRHSEGARRAVRKFFDLSGYRPFRFPDIASATWKDEICSEERQDEKTGSAQRDRCGRHRVSAAAEWPCEGRAFISRERSDEQYQRSRGPLLGRMERA
jgi:hypothetical protein